MATETLKQDDTSPALDYTILDDSNQVVDLTGATVVFYMQDEDGVTVVNGASATITDAANGKVEYQWQAADTDTAGIFKGEFVVTFPDGTIRTFPDPGWIMIVISGSVRG
ncbi:MAG: BppU family phage baseplate upper protein [Acidimicrobiia bacterium]